jgi:hypothetical protein
LASPNHIAPPQISLLALFDHFRRLNKVLNFHGAHFLFYGANGRAYRDRLEQMA